MTVSKINQVKIRRPRNSLAESVILDAAETVARSGNELTIRSVAKELNCTPMALYKHFPGKERLMLSLLDRVIGSMKMPARQDDWEKRFIALAQSHLKVLQENPWAIPLLFKNPDPGPSVRKVGEEFLATLKDGGASKQTSVIIFTSLLALNYGWAGFTSTAHPPYSPKKQSLIASQPSPDGRLFPVTADVWDEFVESGSDKYHETAVNQLLQLVKQIP